MTDDRLTIGAFARAVGITTSALRFYDDCGLVRPAAVDPASGYRYYSAGQLDEVLLIRRLRAAGLPLADVRRVLAGPPDVAEHVLTEHLRGMERAVEATELALAAIRGGVTIPGPLLAEAIAQVATAADPDGAIPVLRGILIETDAAEMRLVATDRYRLAVRTLRADPPGPPASAVVPAAELVAAAGWIKNQTSVRVSVGAAGVRLIGDAAERGVAEAGVAERGVAERVAVQREAGARKIVDRLAPSASPALVGGRPPSHPGTTFSGDRPQVVVPVIEDTFPPYRVVLERLPEPTTTAVAPLAPLLGALAPGVRVDLVLDRQLRIGGTVVEAEVAGPPVEVSFAVDTLRAVLSAGLGPDVLLRISGPELPVLVRSADDGEFSMMIMPVRKEHS